LSGDAEDAVLSMSSTAVFCLAMTAKERRRWRSMSDFEPDLGHEGAFQEANATYDGIKILLIILGGIAILTVVVILTMIGVIKW
jgi:hypothetical protein